MSPICGAVGAVAFTLIICRPSDSYKPVTEKEAKPVLAATLIVSPAFKENLKVSKDCPPDIDKFFTIYAAVVKDSPVGITAISTKTGFEPLLAATTAAMYTLSDVYNVLCTLADGFAIARRDIGIS
jgi:hypothetical protein